MPKRGGRCQGRSAHSRLGRSRGGSSGRPRLPSLPTPRPLEKTPPTCPECNKSFKSQWALVVHARSHTGERPFVCTDCGKRFGRKDHLLRHRHVHTGEKPFACSHCLSSFMDSSTLSACQHVPTGEKPYKCSECGRTLSQNLISAVLIYDGSTSKMLSWVFSPQGEVTMLTEKVSLSWVEEELPLLGLQSLLSPPGAFSSTSFTPQP